MRMDQRMKLAPRMIQSMEILQMTSQALEARIEQELASNPTLELHEPGADAEQLKEERSQEIRDSSEGERELVVKDESADQNNTDDFERLANISESYGDAWEANTYETGESYRRVRDSGERDVKLDAMANTSARSAGLTDQLLAQWSLLEPPAPIDKAGQFLIGFIDNDGYIRTDRQALIDQAPPEIIPENLDQALELIQQGLEPTGLGAHDLRQCLLLQIDAKAHAMSQQANTPTNGAGEPLQYERVLVDEFLKDIEANRLPRIAKSTGLTIDQVKQTIINLRQFYPHPGRLLVEERPRILRPDAVIEYDEQQDCYVARLTHERIPSLQISPQYLKMVRDTNITQQTRQFVGNNLRAARWLMEAIQQRHSTLLRVIHVVLEAQRDYFGAHTYERVDKPRGEFFHTDWTGHGGKTAASAYIV